MNKKLPQHLEDRLLDYLDGNLTAAQRIKLEQQLQTNSDLQARLEELRLADQALRHFNLEQPSSDFTATLMARLGPAPAPSPALSIRKGIMLLIGIVIVMAILVVSLGVFDETATLELNHVTLIQDYVKQTIPGIPIDGKLIVNAMILLNMALAFIVLDRAILRPLFKQRVEHSRQ